MRRIFADTSGWASFFVPEDPRHRLAFAIVAELQEEGGILVTTSHVITELVSLLTSPFRLSRKRQNELLDAIFAASWVEVVHIDPAVDLRARQMLRTHDDKLWSLVDCSSFIVMRDRKIRAALTGDHHFEQAGFERLLK